MLLILNSCSSGLKLKNWVNYPIPLASLNALDTLKVMPDVVRYTGNEIISFREFETDISILGRLDDRPNWYADARGCLNITNGATVHISDFNFRTEVGDAPLIRVSSGLLILENCDFKTDVSWAIQVEGEGKLELRNAVFKNLSIGGIQVNGGQIKIFNSLFDQAGKSAISAKGGALLEAHNIVISNTMGSAVVLESIDEVWLDSVRVLDSFQDGLSITNCDYVLMEKVEVRENGRNGLNLQASTICGMVNFSALGNLVKGIQLNDVDTLRIINSELIGNGQNGGHISKTARVRVSGIRVGHNGGNGLEISRGDKLWIERSSFQANPDKALLVDSLNQVILKQISLVNNGIGLEVSNFDSVNVSHSLLHMNRLKAAHIQAGNYLSSRVNLIKSNQLGLSVSDVLIMSLDSNHFELNELGCDIRSGQRLMMNDNVWQGNQTATYLSEMGSVGIYRDKWNANTTVGLDVFAGDDLLLTQSTFTKNTTAGLFTDVSVKLESCHVDSSVKAGLRVNTGNIFINQSSVKNSPVGLSLGEGSQARIVQSAFSNNELNIDAEASVSLVVSFSKISDSRKGIRVGNYGEVELLSNQFSLIDDYSVRLTGPHLQSLLIRQNVMSQTGGVLYSKSGSGEINIQSNTFSNNNSGFQAKDRTIHKLDHNIFYHTDMDNHAVLKDPALFDWNCIYPSANENDSTEVMNNNLIGHPQFDSNYYLTPRSPCLNGGENGTLIGALGLLPETRPQLKP
mgnify:CR=1 FL=1